MLFLDERSVLFRPESNREQNGIDTDLSGGESFASAQDQVMFISELVEIWKLSRILPLIFTFPAVKMV